MEVSGRRIDTAVVLAGGMGSRLWPLTNNQPKPMVKLLDKPILQWTVEWLKREKIKHIVMGVAYRKEAIMNYFQDGRDFDVDISYSIHSVVGETGEGFRLAIERYVDDETFVAMNGDEITNEKLHEMALSHFEKDVTATILASPLRCPFGTLEIDDRNYVTKFNEKPLIPSILVSAGIYIFNHDIIDYLPEKGRIEVYTFPRLAEEGKVSVYNLKGYWFTINSKKDLTKVTEELKKIMDGNNNE